MRKVFIVCLSAFCFFSCATGYQASGFKGGFEQTQLDDNVFKVSFRGNAYTSKEKVSDYALLRCAEVTLQNDFKYFVIKDNKDFSKTSTNYDVQKNNNYSQYNNNVYSMNENTTTKARLENTIECYKEKPKTENTVYNAEITQRNLKQKYNIK